jgi:hypothetical protein
MHKMKRLSELKIKDRDSNWKRGVKRHTKSDTKGFFAYIFTQRKLPIAIQVMTAEAIESISNLFSFLRVLANAVTH